MNAERLLEVYEQISEAPDAIARLRRFVLDLAVRGKLVEQDAGDEPSLQHLLSLDEIPGKGRKLLKPLTSSEAGAETPSSWHWLRLGAIIRGMDAGWSPQCEPHPRESEDQWGVLKTTAVQALSFSPEQHKLLPEKLKPRPEFQAEIGDILVTRAGPKNRVGVSCVVDVPCPKLMISDKLIRFHTYGALEPRYIALTLNAGISLAHIEDAKSGMAVMQMNISQAKLRAVPIPLPPLAEQHRIVAKVDELMTLCDRLEEARKAREEVRDKLTAASLARLTAPDTTAQAKPAKLGTGFASGSATSEDDFPTHAAFALEALPALTTRPEQIKTLRQTILNLAVRGKLVEQDAADEKSPRIAPPLPDRIVRPFEIPTSWQWARLQSLGVMKGGGTPSKSRDDFWNGEIPWVSPKDMKVDYISSAQLSITDEAISGSSVNLLPPESVLFVVRGMILAHSFPVAISRVPLTINQDMKAIVLKDRRQSEYVLRALWGMKPEMLERVQRSSHGTCRIESKEYSDFLIPIPPLAEQHRIVAKVDALMALCDRLEAALTTTDTTRTRLLEALLHEALEPASVTLEAAQ